MGENPRISQTAPTTDFSVGSRRSGGLLFCSIKWWRSMSGLLRKGSILFETYAQICMIPRFSSDPERSRALVWFARVIYRHELTYYKLQYEQSSPMDDQSPVSTICVDKRRVENQAALIWDRKLYRSRWPVTDSGDQP